MNKIVLSIIIPVYNIEKYIKDCIVSIECQNCANRVEILCINDGSTDSSRDVILSCMEKYSNIKLFDQNNAGVSVARNNGMKHAVGKYIWFVDGDDYLVSGALPFIIKILEQDIINEMPLIIKVKGVDEFQKKPKEIRKFRAFIVKYKPPAGPSFLILPTKKIIDCKFDKTLSYGEDYYWTFLLGNIFEKAIKLTPELYCYRRRSNSAMSSRDHNATQKRIESFINLYDRYESAETDGTICDRNKKELARRKRQCIQACLLTAISNHMSLIETQELLKNLKQKKMYPYKIVLENLKPRKNIREYKSNLVALLLPLEKYFWIIYRLVNKS